MMNNRQRRESPYFTYPDTVSGFLDYITKDQEGKIAIFCEKFRNTITTLYHDTTPEQFVDIYKIFKRDNLISDTHLRKFIYYDQNDEQLLDSVKRVYASTKHSESSETNKHPPCFMFTLNLWLEIWRS